MMVSISLLLPGSMIESPNTITAGTGGVLAFVSFLLASASQRLKKKEDASARAATSNLIFESVQVCLLRLALARAIPLYKPHKKSLEKVEGNGDVGGIYCCENWMGEGH